MNAASDEKPSLGERIRAYADREANTAPKLDLDLSATPGDRGPLLVILASIGTIAAAAVLTSFVTGLWGRGGLGVEPTALPSPSPTLVATPSHGSPSPSPTSPAIAGELPGPSASVPPRPPGVAGITIHDVAAIAGRFGLECESFSQDPSMGGSYGLDCRATADGISYSVTSGYWAIDYVDDVVSVVIAADEGSLQPGTASSLFQALAGGLLGEEARQFVEGHVDDPGCADVVCEFVVEGTRLELQVGADGARQFSMTHAN